MFAESVIIPKVSASYTNNVLAVIRSIDNIDPALLDQITAVLDHPETSAARRAVAVAHLRALWRRHVRAETVF